MQDELESQVWLLVQKTCDQPKFAQLIDDAVCSYKREPGLDSLVRLHASSIGLNGVRTLHEVMQLRGFDAGGTEGYVELRQRLKTHLRDQLQWHLVMSELAGDEIKENQLEKDLGL